LLLHTTTLQYPTYIQDLKLGTTKQRDPSQHAAQHLTSPAHQQQEQSNPRRFSGQSAAQCGLTRLQPHRTSPDNRLPMGGLTLPQSRRIFTPLRIIGCPRADSLTHSLTRSSLFSGQQAAHGRIHSPTASLDLHASPDNRLSRADSLASSLAGPLRNTRQPAAQDASPAASPVHSVHLHRPTT
jgi:hypothetical protein